MVLDWLVAAALSLSDLWHYLGLSVPADSAGLFEDIFNNIFHLKEITSVCVSCMQEATN